MKPVASAFASLVLSALMLSACEFRSRHAYWNASPSVTYRLRYAADTKAKADGSWGASTYAASVRAEFTAQSSADTSKGQIYLNLSVDTLNYRSSERVPDEDQYMSGRLKKYKGKLTLSRTGQLLALEEEPGLPPVAFSPLHFGRLLAFALPTFPEHAIKKGSRWEINQPLQDKFHPGSRIRKSFALSAIRETPEGDLATCLVEMEVFLDEDLGGGEPAAGPALTGSGSLVFNLSKGRPVSAEIELEGVFAGQAAAKPAGDSTQPEALPLRLQEKLSLSFSD